ncbi:hypothetical protein [uncultured Winogradskyella sp.]|uniref:hypothetical protein n=1 Tax=uncultured Winogradskyella sp. TaxID=395353 RepID=UPI0030D8C9FD|tara:strand:+ start:1697 stop:3070 length:1374 start_codon:yes stop_codon:yes gene_type:complete
MKQIFTLLSVFIFTISLWAQSPEQMNYQAVLRNSANELVTNTQVGMQLSIIQGTADGTAVYLETQTPTTNLNGLVSLQIGTGTTSDDFSSIDWANGPYFIKTETDPAGGSNYTITGTSLLMSVPYALYAKTAGNSSIPEGTSPNDLLLWSGTEWSLLPTGEEGSILKIVDGTPTWTTEVGTGVQFGFQDSFDDLDIVLDQLHSDRAQIKVETEFESSLDPNITSMSLLISTNSNPIPFNSEAREINLQDLNDEFFGSATVTFNNLERDTNYYYRAMINGEFVDENVYGFKTPYAIGEAFQGGILAYVYQPFDDGYVEGEMHGFVVAESALTDTAAWGCEGTNLPGMQTGGSAASTASQNTAIINNCGESDIAAKIVESLTINGYSDWLLPSKDVINNGIRENEVLSMLTGIVDGYYWSCTPHSNNPAQSAWATHLNNGSNIQADKSNLYFIIPVREF